MVDTTNLITDDTLDYNYDTLHTIRQYTTHYYTLWCTLYTLYYYTTQYYTLYFILYYTILHTNECVWVECVVIYWQTFLGGHVICNCLFLEIRTRTNTHTCTHCIPVCFRVCGGMPHGDIQHMRLYVNHLNRIKSHYVQWHSISLKYVWLSYIL